MRCILRIAEWKGFKIARADSSSELKSDFGERSVADITVGAGGDQPYNGSLWERVTSPTNRSLSG